MMTTYRWSAFAVALSTLAGCQILSGLSGLHERTGMGGGGAGGSSTSTSTSSTSTSSTGSTSTSSTSSSGSCMANTTNDPKNCGVCNHDCGPGDCVGSLCQPYELVQAGTVTALATNGTHLYWGANSTPRGIFRCALPACMQLEEVAADINARALVADGTYAYAYDANGGGIIKARPGSPVTPLYPSVNPVTRMFLVASTTLLWNDPDNGRIWSGTTVGETAVHISAAVGDLRFAADGKHVYWSGANQILKRKLPLASPDPQTQVHGAGGFSNLAADPASNGYVYFADSAAAGTVGRAKKDGTTPPSSATFSTAEFLDALLVDERNVYWTNYAEGSCTGTGALVAQAANGGSAYRLANVTGCDPVAQDQNALYFVDDGKIYRVIKPVL